MKYRKEIAFRRMENSEMVLTTHEAWFFEVLGGKDHDKFKETSKLIREIVHMENIFS